MMTSKAKTLLVLPLCLMISGCYSGRLDFLGLNNPEKWTAKKSELVDIVDAGDLHEWWKGFDAPVLDRLVEMAMAQSPDRGIAEAKILEARGMRRTSKSALFPQIGGSASKGKEDNGWYAGEFYDARFDASYELDIFGKNRKGLSAAEAQLRAAEASYHDVTLTLIAEISRVYVEYRAAQNQLRIARKNLKSQDKTYTLISDLNRLGEAPRLDVERAANLVSTTQASIPEYQRQADNARLQLTVLTGVMPEELSSVLVEDASIPGGDVMPVLMAPADVVALRPDILAASANLAAHTALAESTTAEFFPTFTLRGFYGITDSALVSSATIWNVAAGAAVSLLDFGRIEGKIDAARAREKQAYEQYRKTVLAAVTEVETALTDYAAVKEQQISLHNAYKSADKALDLSQALYKEGEISFLDVLDAQRSANQAEAALVQADAAQAESLVRLYKSLGVY